MKSCTKKACKQINPQPASNFTKGKNYKDGLSYYCRECQKSLHKAYYLANPKQESRNKWLKLNRDKARDCVQKCRSKPDKRAKHNAYNREWFKANKEKASFYTNLRRARIAQATPTWLSDEQLKIIELFYINRPKGHHVDHVIPIHGKNVSGLHVPWNLQYLTGRDNCKKGNKLT
jgi:hypothetical protein